VVKAFDIVRVKGLPYKITVLNFPTFLVQAVSSHLDGRKFRTSLKSAASTRRVMRAAVAQGGFICPAFFRLCKPLTLTVPPRRLSAVRARYGSRSHVSQYITARGWQHLQEHRCALC
jgi:hypothetical protein